MAENKTQATGASVQEFLAAVEHPVRRADGFRLLRFASDYRVALPPDRTVETY